MLGDTVNVASRLEALTRELGATLAASDRLVARACQETGGRTAVADLVRCPPRPVRGREAPLVIWVLPRPGAERAPLPADSAWIAPADRGS